MAFQSRFRETERHAFGERGGHSEDAASGEPSEVRTNASYHVKSARTPTQTNSETSPNYKLHVFPL
jgi:hypothetical protein